MENNVENKSEIARSILAKFKQFSKEKEEEAINNVLNNKLNFIQSSK